METGPYVPLMLCRFCCVITMCSNPNNASSLVKPGNEHQVHSSPATVLDQRSAGRVVCQTSLDLLHLLQLLLLHNFPCKSYGADACAVDALRYFM